MSLCVCAVKSKAKGFENVGLRGKAAIRAVKVRQHDSVLSKLHDVYIYALRLPLSTFVLITFSSPLILSILFTGFYLLDMEGFHVPEGAQPWWDGVVPGLVEKGIRIFIFSFSLSTNFGGATVEARSPCALLLANLNTLMAQLMFVFFSGAVFHRLSQPVEPVRWSMVALITDDQYAEAESRLPAHEAHKTYKSFLIRLNLVDPQQLILIECHFELVCQRFLTLPGQPTPFITGINLKLVRPRVSYLKYGLIIRHIIDETSPLFNMDIEALHNQDVSFLATVSALEKSSMQPVFSEMLYAVTDGDIMWDHQFDDQIITDNSGHLVFDFKALNKLRPLKAEKPVNGDGPETPQPKKTWQKTS
ncbi:hypothetical protein M758_3G014200 [Ceratodon purpureus]|nr:hypothetical protein M758_3G014200 [Ceratodon purpureus]